MNSILKTAFALLILVSANANAGHDDRALAGAVIGGIIGGTLGLIFPVLGLFFLNREVVKEHLS